MEQENSTEQEKIAVLYIDDEENNLFAFKASFRRDYTVYTAVNTRVAREIMSENEIQVIISDQRMPVETGVEFFEDIKMQYPEQIRILLTGFSDIEAVIDSINKGEVFRYLTKPWNEADLRLTINNAFEIFDLRRKNRELTEQLKLVNEQLEFLLRQNLIS